MDRRAAAYRRDPGVGPRQRPGQQRVVSLDGAGSLHAALRDPPLAPDRRSSRAPRQPPSAGQSFSRYRQRAAGQLPHRALPAALWHRPGRGQPRDHPLGGAGHHSPLPQSGVRLVRVNYDERGGLVDCDIEHWRPDAIRICLDTRVLQPVAGRSQTVQLTD